MSAEGLSPLRGHRYVRMTTYRRDGRGVATPVWFAFPEGENAGRIYVVTGSNTGKAKRIRAGSPADLTPCNFRGTPVQGAGTVRAAGRFLGESESEAAEAALAAKYGLQYRAFSFIENRLTGSGDAERIFLELRYREILWIGFSGHAATFSSVPSTSSPFLNFAPALTSATR